MSTMNTTNQVTDLTDYSFISTPAENDSTPAKASILLALKQLKMYQASMSLTIWVLPVIILVGLTGNMLSFAVMMKRNMHQTSTWFYLAVLAVVDTIVLLASGLKTWVRAWTGFELLHVSNIGCKVLIFLIHTSLHMSAWLIVAVTIERFIAIWFPLKASALCSIKRARVVTFGMLAALSILNCHLFWTSELIRAPNSTNSDQVKCTTYDYENITCITLSWINLTVYSLCPFLVLLLFNTMIIICLLRHKQMITNAMTKDDQQLRYNHRKLATALLAISFAWILTTVPTTMYSLFPRTSHNTEDIAWNFLIKVVCFLLLYTNHAINFFLYCITGRRFRHELTNVLCHKKKHKPRPKLIFKSSISGHDSTHPLIENFNMNIVLRH